MTPETKTSTSVKPVLSSWISRRALGVILAIIVLVVLLDQFTKALVRSALLPGEIVNVVPGLFDLTLHFNRGAAFGMMANLPDGVRSVALGLAVTFALLCVLYFLVKDYSCDRFGQAALALVLGGALGNLIDRFRLGMVVDFLDFYIGQYHWPAFNVADSAICIGVIILILRQPRHKQA